MTARGGALAETIFHVDGNTVSFWILVKPRSSRESLERAPAGELCLRIHAAPTEGQANEACIRFLARYLRLPRQSVSIQAGHRSRRKLVRVTGRSARQIIEQLQLTADR
jgi:uncharacterized protein (TIGR00251 family)